jgi:hypothetical protein
VADDVSLGSVDLDGVPGEWSIAPGSGATRVLLFFHGGGYCSGSILSLGAEPPSLLAGDGMTADAARAYFRRCPKRLRRIHRIAIICYRQAVRPTRGLVRLGL